MPITTITASRSTLGGYVPNAIQTYIEGLPTRSKGPLPDFKPIPFDAVMLLSEFQLEQIFPHGAAKDGKKWKPAAPGKADRSLKELLKDKRKRYDKPRFMASGAPQRLQWSSKEKRWVVKPFTSDEEHGYTGNASKSLEAADVLPVEVQEQYSKEARERFASVHSEDLSRAALRSYMARLRELAIERIKAGGDPSPIFESALAELAKQDDQKAA